MNIIIVEDEQPAAKRLANMLKSIDNSFSIQAHLESIESTVKYLQAATNIDLIFMDIQLADGLSFEIFKQVQINVPVIFTTAFDQYSIKAFKVNSIDYLLKPIDEEELTNAINKFKLLFFKKENAYTDKLLKLIEKRNPVKYKERLLIQAGQQISFIKTEQIAYFIADGKLCFAFDFENKKHLLDDNLTQLEEYLMPIKFFRINRQIIVNIDAIAKVHTWFGSRLKLDLKNENTKVDTVVSRERINKFKEWLGK